MALKQGRLERLERPLYRVRHHQAVLAVKRALKALESALLEGHLASLQHGLTAVEGTPGSGQTVRPAPHVRSYINVLTCVYECLTVGPPEVLYSHAGVPSRTHDQDLQDPCRPDAATFARCHDAGLQIGLRPRP